MLNFLRNTSLVLLFLAFCFPSIGYSEDRLVVKDSLGNETFKVEDNGSVFTNGASAPSYGGDGNIFAYNPNSSGVSGSLLGVYIPNTASAWGGFTIGFGNTTKWLFGLSNNAATPEALVFYEDAAAANPRFFIYPGGKVQVGSAGKEGELDVYGSILQRGGTLHADYVFSEDYHLESIEQHSQLMWQNKHLPSVPALKQDGQGREIVNIGSQRRGTLEELEKAHIYIEQLNKRLKSLEEKILNAGL